MRALSAELLAEDANRDALRKGGGRAPRGDSTSHGAGRGARAEARLGTDTVRRVLDSGITGLTPSNWTT